MNSIDEIKGEFVFSWRHAIMNIGQYTDIPGPFN